MPLVFRGKGDVAIKQQRLKNLLKLMVKSGDVNRQDGMARLRASGFSNEEIVAAVQELVAENHIEVVDDGK